MTILNINPEDWRKKALELSSKPSKMFKILWVVPVEIIDGKVTKLQVGYYFVERHRGW